MGAGQVSSLGVDVAGGLVEVHRWRHLESDLSFNKWLWRMVAEEVDLVRQYESSGLRLGPGIERNGCG